MDKQGPVEKYTALLSSSKFLFVVCKLSPVPAHLLQPLKQIPRFPRPLVPLLQVLSHHARRSLAQHNRRRRQASHHHRRTRRAPPSHEKSDRLRRRSDRRSGKRSREVFQGTGSARRGGYGAEGVRKWHGAACSPGDWRGWHGAREVGYCSECGMCRESFRGGQVC